MLTIPHTRFAALMFVVFLFAMLPASALGNQETGKLKIHVSPKQAYVFVDGKAIRDGSQTIDLSAGMHEVGVDNYGFIPKTQVVHIGAGETTDLAVVLQSSGDVVAGPFGEIEFKGDPRAAVLLNGSTPDYFVGHVDEFDWNWIWHQRLLVHPGTFHVIVTQEGNTNWSGPVTVKAGQQVTVYLDHNGEMATRNWPEGNTMPPQPRFHAGMASATVPVAPVTAKLAAQSTELSCGQSTQLNWKATDAVAVSITKLGNVSEQGDRNVRPEKTTTYELVAKGPGGEATRMATINVQAQPTASLTLSEPVAHYHKIGDKVVTNDSVTLKWSVSNGNKVAITPLGSEPISGTQTIDPQPKQMGTGPVNETFGYTLSASNACGGKADQTALLHVVGSIDPPPAVTLASIFYPTDYPVARHPKIGLVASEKETLSNAAHHFENHAQYDEHARLTIVGHADVRGSKKHNLELSDRRADLVKSYLVSQGVPADRIQTRAVGKSQELSKEEVAKLQSEDAQKPEKWMMRHSPDTWLAYNRRVDIILEPSGQLSKEIYPNDTPETRVLWQRPQPSLKKVELAAKTPVTSQPLHAGLTRN
ncbi:MAG: OmpA family protein [Candidatus Acidiferrales bacterium]